MITTSVAKFILIVVFVHGNPGRSNFTTLGEYNTKVACQNAAEATSQASSSVGYTPKFVCANKGKQ